MNWKLVGGVSLLLVERGEGLETDKIRVMYGGAGRRRRVRTSPQFARNPLIARLRPTAQAARRT